jgi:hypothetical protein
LLGDRALLGGSEYGLVEVLPNGASQKKIKNHFIPQFSELSKNSLYSYPQFSELSQKTLYTVTNSFLNSPKTLYIVARYYAPWQQRAWKKSGHQN